MKTLFKRDSTGRIRTWSIEVSGDSYRTISGLLDGAKVESGWTVATPKNVGRSNETTAEEQARLEAEAEYRKKLELGYFENIEDVDNPTFFEPMLAQKYSPKVLKGQDKVFAQPKLDGIRCIARADGLWTRKGKPIVAVPHIYAMLRPLFERDPDLILDGELYNHDLRDNFNEIASIVRKTKLTQEDFEKAECSIQYHVYDIPSLGHRNFGERYLEAAHMITRYGDEIEFVDTYEVTDPDHLDQLHSKFLQDGYEGQMIRLDAPYEQKRSKALLKRKEFLDEEFEIVRIEEGNGGWRGFAKKVTLKLPDGREFGAGIKGSQAFTLQLLKEADKYVGQQATVRYFERTPDGIPRFPVAVAFHEGERL